MADKPTVELPKPCPFCGNPNVYKGITSAITYGVRCQAFTGGCGAELSVEMPDETPEFLQGCTAKEFHLACIGEAIKLWNCRAI
jgi:hypothetical protein